MSLLERVCKFCGKRFVPLRKWQLFCCDEHREAWHRKAREAGKQVLDSKQ